MLFQKWSLTRILFPETLEVSADSIRTVRVRSFLLPWVKEEERMSLAKVSSVRRLKGVIWDRLILETSGGSNVLDLEGMRKRDAEAAAAAIMQRQAEWRLPGAALVS